MTDLAFEFPHYPPEFEVWNHIESAIDQAASELNNLGTRERILIEQVARLVASLQTAFALPPDQREVYQLLQQLMENPWFRHAADLEIVKNGVYRATHALDRYVELQPVFTSYSLSPTPRAYLAEAIRTYAMGFDAAAIAFCGATLERLLHDALQRSGKITPVKSLDERTPPVTRLLNLAFENLLKSSQAAATRLVDQRDRVMHRYMLEPEILRGVARQCIRDLAEVLSELPGTQP